MPLAAADYSVEESFAESLGSLFAQPQVAITKAPGQTWTHESTGVVLAIPQVQEAENWSLQADAIWMASIYLADHPEIMQDSFEGTTLELGSGGGLLGTTPFSRSGICLNWQHQVSQSQRHIYTHA